MSALLERLSDYQSLQREHHGYSLSAAALERLEWYLAEYFRGTEVRSVETGCGASTILFAQYASHHTVYCFDDRSSETSSVNYARSFPAFCNDRVTWIFGPAQRNVFTHPPEHPVDLVLLDGPHAYPFPDLQYFALYRSLRPRSILILDDIHIPTINHLYNFLLQDDSFRSHGATSTTAYFQRSDSPPFNLDGDDWWLQRYNVQRFPAVPITRVDERLELPVRIMFDETRLKSSAVLRRGFSLSDIPPIAEGAVSQIEIPLPKEVPDHLRIELDLEPICAQERKGGVTVLVNGNQVGTWDFRSQERRTIAVDLTAEGADVLSLEFWNTGLTLATDLQAWPKPWFDGRLPNFRLHALSILQAASQATPNNLRRADGSLVSFDYEGKQFTFFVDQLDDSVEVFHSRGRFYELQELETLRRYMPRGAVILDVGAHVGNHTVYFAKVMGASRVIAVEPNLHSAYVLRMNCRLNSAVNVDLSHLGKALGSVDGFGSLHRDDPYNSGGTRIQLNGGPVPIVRGDELFEDDRFDLIRIDVEGMELDVLAGLTKTIARSQPLIFVEVTDEHMEEFTAFVEKCQFHVAWKGQMYAGINNVLLKPGSRAAG